MVTGDCVQFKHTDDRRAYVHKHIISKTYEQLTNIYKLIQFAN